MINTKSELKYRRKKLRNNMTEAEKELWKYLRKNQLGVKFRRQHSIDYYIADFYCTQLKLVIEIDGNQHYTKEGKEYDELRENFMKTLEIETLRFSNVEVMNDIDAVLEKIKEYKTKYIGDEENVK